MACERIFAFFLALVVLVAAIEAGAITRKRSTSWGENELMPQKVSQNLSSKSMKRVCVTVRSGGMGAGKKFAGIPKEIVILFFPQTRKWCTTLGHIVKGSGVGKGRIFPH